MPDISWVGTIARHIVKAPTFRGLPRTQQQKFELAEDAVAQLSAKLNGVNFCYNHADNLVIGSVTENWRTPGGAWKVRFSVHDRTPQAKECQDWIRLGIMRGLSLKHRPSDLTPLEVSACWEGMRPGTHIYHDSKRDRYTSDAVEASATSNDTAAADDADADSELLFLDYVAGSIMMEEQPPPAQAPPPPSPQAPPAAGQAAHAQAAPDDSGTMDADFETTRVVEGIVPRSHNKILTKEERERLRVSVATLEKEKLEAVALAKRQAEEIARHKAELEAARKEAAASAVAVHEAEQRNAHAKQVIGDFAKTYGSRVSPEDDAEIGEVLASLTPAQTQFFAKRAQALRDAAVKPGSAGEDTEMKDAAAAADEEEDEVERLMRSWKQSKQQNRAKAPAPPPPSAKPRTAAATATAAPPTTFNSWNRPAEPVAASSSAAGDLDEIAASWQPGVEDVVWGTPIARRPRELHDFMCSDQYLREVAASAPMLDAQGGGDGGLFHGGRNGLVKPPPMEFAPGAGPNFPHEFMSVDQIRVHMMVPSAEGASKADFRPRECGISNALWNKLRLDASLLGVARHARARNKPRNAYASLPL